MYTRFEQDPNFLAVQYGEHRQIAHLAILGPRAGVNDGCDGARNAGTNVRSCCRFYTLEFPMHLWCFLTGRAHPSKWA
jgi:hypothetical protein